MSVSSVAAFWAVAGLLIAVPGADWAFVIGAAVRQRAVLPAVAGLVAGYSALTAIVAAGLGAVVAASPAVLTGLTLVGGVYLLWHGATTFRRTAAPLLAADTTADTAADAPPRADGAAGAEGAAQGADGRWRLLGRGVGVSGLNPKGLLLFVALLPQFTDTRARLPVAAQIGVLGLVFVLTCAAFYLTLGGLARVLLRARPRAARGVGRVAGAAMVLVGLLLVTERLLR